MKDQYLLQDGTYADPKDCSEGKDGVLRHKNGLAVAKGENGEPMTLSKTTELNAKAAEMGEPQVAADPEPKTAQPKGKKAS